MEPNAQPVSAQMPPQQPADVGAPPALQFRPQEDIEQPPPQQAAAAGVHVVVGPGYPCNGCCPTICYSQSVQACGRLTIKSSCFDQSVSVQVDLHRGTGRMRIFHHVMWPITWASGPMLCTLSPPGLLMSHCVSVVFVRSSLARSLSVRQALCESPLLYV